VSLGGIFGPKVMIINEMSGSGGDALRGISARPVSGLVGRERGGWWHRGYPNSSTAERHAPEQRFTAQGRVGS